ncbi:MAG: hypothetical protein CUN55_16695 [Phototrophicales bacterium]|nr:MAG: hypothetical protein CUN55_16695 [Phototrophicales bacterium]
MHKLKYAVKYKTDDKGYIHLLEELQGQLVRTVINTRDQAVREALIELGWTPPEEEHQPFKGIED